MTVSSYHPESVTLEQHYHRHEWHAIERRMIVATSSLPECSTPIDSASSSLKQQHTPPLRHINVNNNNQPFLDWSKSVDPSSHVHPFPAVCSYGQFNHHHHHAHDDDQNEMPIHLAGALVGHVLAAGQLAGVHSRMWYREQLLEWILEPQHGRPVRCVVLAHGHTGPEWRTITLTPWVQNQNQWQPREVCSRANVHK